MSNNQYQQTFTVPEVRNLDYSIRMLAIEELQTRLRTLCKKHSIDFFAGASTNNVRSMRTSKAVDFAITDLLHPQTQYIEVNEICKALGKHVYVITDNPVNYNNLECVTFFQLPQLYGFLAVPEWKPAKPPSKLFNCLIQRSCSVRQSWLYFLYNNNLFDKGYVSYLLKNINFRTDLLGREQFDWLHHNFKLNELPHFESAYQVLKNQVPYRNFENHPDVTKFVADSKYSLILESYAVDDDRNAWCFTEKTIRTLQIPTYPLLFMQRSGITKLKNLGFEVVVDHDNFENLDWPQRQHAILDILINDSIEYNKSLLNEASQHNFNLVNSWKLEYLQPNFFDCVFDQI